MMGPFLLLIGFLLLYISATGKSPQFIEALFANVATKAQQEEKNLGNDLGTFFKYHIWNNLTNAIIRGLPIPDINVGNVHIGFGKPTLQSTDPNNPSKQG